MAVTDRWHRSHPDDDAKPCKCGTARRPLYPTAEHKQGEQWQVRWRDDNGKAKSLNRPRRGGKRDETNPNIFAEALDAKIRTELNQGTYVDPSAGDVTLEVFAKRWREDLTGDPVSLEKIDNRLVHIVGEASPIAKRPMRELAKKPSSIQSWVKGLENKGLSPGYIHQIVSTASTIFNAAMIDGVVNRNPIKTDAVNPPTVTRKRIVPWTLEQVRAAGADLGGRDAAMADLGAGAGLRQGEIFGFGEDQIDWSNQMIRVIRQVRLVGKVPVFSLPKGDKERDVPMSDTVTLMLLMQIEEFPPVEVTLPWDVPGGDPHTERLLFVRADGSVHHRKNFSYTWPKARKAAGAPDTRENGMHILRHTFASACLSEGVDIRTVAEWLGHSDPGFTLKTYAHLMPSAAERGRKAMDEFFRFTEQSARKVPSEE